jgi:hypothetical protein
MARAEVIVKVLDIPGVREHIERLEWQVECLTLMLRSQWCSQCGNTWANGRACGPIHAAIAANHPSLSGAPDLPHDEVWGTNG